MQKLDKVNPLKNPQVPSQVNPDFTEQIQKKLELAQAQRDKLEGELDDLKNTKDKLVNVTVQPLSELADRVVDKESEIDEILKALGDLKVGLSDKANDLKVENDKVKDLEDSVASMLEQDKGRKIGQADSALKDLDDILDDLNGHRDEA
jgi:chromosome segregation ATPase